MTESMNILSVVFCSASAVGEEEEKTDLIVNRCQKNAIQAACIKRRAGEVFAT